MLPSCVVRHRGACWPMPNPYQELLERARRNVWLCIGQAGQLRTACALNWLQALKLWESCDDIHAAYWEDRLVVRAFGPTLAPDHVITLTNPFPRVYESNDFERQTNLKDQHAGRITQLAYKYDTSQLGILKRKDPRNFDKGGVGGVNRKYELGLHDISATLVNRVRPIADQLHKKEDAKVMFLPLSQMEDQALCSALLLSLEQQPADPELAHFIRARVTRVKIAGSTDLGTGFTAFPRGREYKLKYTLPTSGIPDELTYPEFLARHQHLARNFSDILKNQPGPKNEVLLAVRGHGNPYMPVFAYYKEPTQDTGGTWFAHQLRYVGSKWVLSRTDVMVFHDPKAGRLRNPLLIQGQGAGPPPPPPPPPRKL